MTHFAILRAPMCRARPPRNTRIRCDYVQKCHRHVGAYRILVVLWLLSQYLSAHVPLARYITAGESIRIRHEQCRHLRAYRAQTWSRLGRARPPELYETLRRTFKQFVHSRLP